MSVNQQTLQGNWNEIKGKLRKRWGQLSDDELESAHGSIEQLIGAIQRQTGEGREAVEHYLDELTNDGASAIARAAETVRDYSEHAKESVEDAAKHVKDAVQSGYEKTESAIHKRPVESLVVCFGVGLITGAVVGILLRSR